MADLVMGVSGGHGDPLNNKFKMVVPDGHFIKRIVVKWGEALDSIQIFHGPYDGTATDDIMKAGGTAGAQTTDLVVGMNFPTRNAIRNISGKFGMLVDNIRFESSDGSSVNAGPFPSQGWNDYNYQTPDGYHIVGFWGTVANRGGVQVVSSIGAVYRPLP